MSGINKTNQYLDFIAEIKNRIRQAQYSAFKAVNREMIGLYWDIGRMIIERQAKYAWGKAVVENMARDLQTEFPGMQGYSKDNLWRMRKFYLQYKDSAKLAPLVQEIGWAHNVVIMEMCGIIRICLNAAPEGRNQNKRRRNHGLH